MKTILFSFFFITQDNGQSSLGFSLVECLVALSIGAGVMMFSVDFSHIYLKQKHSEEQRLFAELLCGNYLHSFFGLSDASMFALVSKTSKRSDLTQAIDSAAALKKSIPVQKISRISGSLETAQASPSLVEFTSQIRQIEIRVVYQLENKSKEVVCKKRLSPSLI